MGRRRCPFPCNAPQRAESSPGPEKKECSMTDTTQLPVTTEEQKARQAREQAQVAEPKTLDALHTEHGDTTIADTVVEKLAGIATREVVGVYAMGSAAGRAISSIAQR